MTGIVVVSHSRALAQAAVDLALRMTPQGGPRVEIAAGIDGDELGTDAAAISEAITAAMDDQGVVVFMDLGSAIISAQTALEFVDPEVADKVTLSPAPLVEGLVGGVVTAAAGLDRQAVADEAARAVDAKAMQLSD